MIELEMKRIRPKQIALGLLFLLCLAISGWQLLVRQYLPVAPGDTSLVEVRLPENSSARQVAELLKENGLIRNETIFLGYLHQKGMEKQLKAGLYAFSKSQSLPELAGQIAQGQVMTSAFTVPEGFTVHQIGELLINKQICTQPQWEEALQGNYNYDFLPVEGPADEKRLEGFLFPDTYTIDDQTGAEDIINMMLQRFASVWNSEYASMADSQQLKVRDVIIIASLVEREARVAGERQRIAGVIYNRLRQDMPLQIDATILYSLGQHQDTVTYQDLEINSPYNTYKYYGLPPGPIASPGRAAIEAALNPEANNYYYYVATGDGSHYFSATYAEHLAARQKYGI
ncbi:MAG: endolytic transglycosylase MltG [Syntrophomonadaceae bacterium]|nr:endolytic transglycosylase MltG [Syntrophomonadaceae bacterium]